MALEDNTANETKQDVIEQVTDPTKQPAQPAQPTPPKVSKEQQAALDKLNFVTDNIGKITSQNAQDKNFYVKPYSYDPENSSNPNQNFERYYSHTSFKKLGFNPWQDNETLYNLKGSSWGDIWRATQAGMKMIPTGFKSAVRSYGDMMQGNFLAEDTASAEEMKRLNLIGSSSRGGVAGFTSNLLVNAGYTVGLTAEMASEMVVGTLLTPETLGGSGAVAIASVANKAKSLGSYFNVVEGFNKAVNTLKNFNMAKTAWETIKATGKFVNPLSNTTDALRALNNSENLTNLAKVSKTAAAFHKDVMFANATLSEAKVEGAYASAELEENLLADYYKENGISPDAEELVRIKQTAQQAGDKTLTWNIPVIMLTNRITFDPLFRRFVPFDDYITKAGTKFAEKKGVGFIKEGAGTGIKGLLKPKAYGKATLGYFKENFSEGAQESLQEIISGTSKDYYRDVYNNASKQGLDQSTGENYTPDAGAILGENVAQQFSGRGFETFASGFFMGGLMKIQGALFQAGRESYNRVFNKERYQEYRKTKDEYDKKTLERLNDLYKDPLKYFGSRIVNFGNASNTVDNQNEAAGTNNKKAWQDVDDQNVWSHIMTALDTGTYDVFLDKLHSIKTMSNEAMQEAYGTDSQEVLSKIGKVIDRANYLKDSYDKWNNRAVNPFNPNMYAKTTPEYEKEAIAYSAWEQAKKNAIFYGYSFDRNAERIKAVQDDLLRSPVFNNVTSTDITPLFDVPTMNKELSLLKQEIASLKGAVGTGVKSELAKKQRKFDRLQEFRQALENHFILQAAQGLPKEERDGFTSSFKNFEKISDSKLKKSYTDYLKHVAAQNNLYYFNNIEAEESFKALKDLHTLRSENRNLSDTINMLANPRGFSEHYDRLNNIFTDIFKNKEKDLQQGLKDTYSRIELNNMLNNLFRLGYVVNDEELSQIVNDKVVPEQFYSVVLKQIVKKGDRDYLTFEAIINDYLSAQKGEPVTEKPVEETVEEAKPAPPTEEVPVKKTAEPYDFKTKIDAIKSGLDLINYENEIMGILGNYDRAVEIGIDKDIETQIFNALKEKEQSVIEAFDPKNLKEGNVVQMYDKKYDRMVVVRKTANQTSLRKIGDNSFIIRIKDEDLTKNIKFKYSDTMAELKAAELTTEEKEKAKENIDNAESLMQDTNALKELQAEAEKEGADKVTDDFIKNLGCK